MKANAYGLTDIGLKRKKNQDSVLVDNDLELYAVADGMGGHKGGEIASKLAIEVAQDFYKQNRHMDPEALIEQIYNRACAKVFDKSQIDTSLQGMGTTLVLCFKRESTFYFGNVGDSRAYLYKDEQLWLMTEDHSLVNDHLKNGVIVESEVAKHKDKNIITRSVGYEISVKVDFIERYSDSAEYYLLSSDGLHGLVGDEKILEICKKYDYNQWPDLLIKEAKKAGGDDNISVVAIFNDRKANDIDAAR